MKSFGDLSVSQCCGFPSLAKLQVSRIGIGTRRNQLSLLKSRHDDAWDAAGDGNARLEERALCRLCGGLGGRLKCLCLAGMMPGMLSGRPKRLLLLKAFAIGCQNKAALSARCQPDALGIHDDAQPNDGYDDGWCRGRRRWAGKAGYCRKCEQLEFDTGLAAAAEKKEEASKVESPGSWRRFTTGRIGVHFVCYRGLWTTGSGSSVEIMASRRERRRPLGFRVLWYGVLGF